MTTIIDTDKSGHGFQKQKVWLGPSLGWSEEYVQPSTLITSGPTYAVEPGDGMLLIDVPAGITILLPDVKKWFQQVANQPATGWNRQICIKDFGGNAQVGNIVVQPFGGQRIDENIGTTSITINNSVFLLVPNIDLSGWVIAAGTTGVLIPVGTFLPVHDPHATGTLRVGDPGGDVLALYGGGAGSQGVFVTADDISVDAVVNVHIIPKSSGGVLMYSNGALQVAVSGVGGANKFIALTGGSPGLNPSISSSFGGPVDVRDSVRVGPQGGNRGLVSGSDAGQQAIIYGVDPASPDADVNVHLIPKNNGGTLLYSHNALQMAVSGPANTTEYLVVSGANGLEDPLIANASGQSIRLDSSILVGPSGGNFAGLFGSAGGGQAVALRADNIANPDVDINIYCVPKGAGSTQFWSNGFPQALINGPANTTRYVSLMGGTASTNPVIQAAFGVDIDILNANLTGVPHCPTAAPGTSTTQVASTAFVMANAGSGGGAFVPLAGGTMTGKLFMGSNAADLQGGNQIVLNGLTAPTTGIALSEWSNDAAAGRIFFAKSRGGAVGTQGVVQLSDRLGDINFSGSDGTSLSAGASISCLVDATPAAGKIPGNLFFSTMDQTTGVFTQRMKIDSGGSVFIGRGPFPAVATAGSLQIDAALGGAATVQISNYQNAAGSAFLSLRHSRGAIGAYGALLLGDPMGTIQFNGSDASSWIAGAQIGGVAHAAPSGGHIPTRLSFVTDNGVNFAERMRLFPSGGLSMQATGGFAIDPGAGGIIADLIGVVTNSNAAAGLVGEQIQSLVQAAVSLGAASAVTVITTISLTAGDWDVSAMSTVISGASAGSFEYGVSTTGTLTGVYDAYTMASCIGAGAVCSVAIPSARFSLSAPATISLVARPGIAGMTATAILRARRER